MNNYINFETYLYISPKKLVISVNQKIRFKKIYKHINFGLIDPVEYLSLLDKPLSTINFMYLIDFMAAHDIKYTTNLAIPKIVKESLNLTLELNTIHQLNILPQHITTTTNHKISSIFDVVNYTITSIGRRHLKQTLTKPFRNPSTINFRYNLTEELMNNFNVKALETHLSNIIDFDRLHRKMGLEALHPYFLTMLRLAPQFPEYPMISVRSDQHDLVSEVEMTRMSSPVKLQTEVLISLPSIA